MKFLARCLFALTCVVVGTAFPQIDFGVTPDDLGGSLGPFSVPSGNPHILCSGFGGCTLALDWQFVQSRHIVFGDATDVPGAPITDLARIVGNSCAGGVDRASTLNERGDWWCQFRIGTAPGDPSHAAFGTTTSFAATPDSFGGLASMIAYDRNFNVVDSSSTGIFTNCVTLSVNAPQISYVRIVGAVSVDGLAFPLPSEDLQSRQPDRPTAAMSLEASDFCGGTPVQSPTVYVTPGGALNLAVGGQPYAPFSTLLIPGNPTVWPPLGTAFGRVDLDVSLLSSLQLIIDGIGGGGLSSLIGNTGPTGAQLLQLFVPPSAATGLAGSLQSLVIDPAASFGLTLTSSWNVAVYDPAPSGCSGTTTTLSMPNDISVQVSLAGGLNAFSFYGTSYSSVFVNANGNLTFGAANTFQPEPAAFWFNPRIAAWWTALSPSQGGAVKVGQTSSSLTVSWEDVPDLQGNLNTFCVKLFDDDRIEMSYGRIGSQPPGAAIAGMVGITPQGSPVMALLEVDLSAGGITGASAGGLGPGIYEVFRTGLHRNPRDLFPECSGGQILRFTPVTDLFGGVYYNYGVF